MDKITMLGTGHAMTFDCFNTCFVYENENGKLLVDTGGGKQLLKQLQEAHIGVSELDAVFISHRHTDHILGLPWLLRTAGGPGGGKKLYLHGDVMQVAKGFVELMFPEKREDILASVEFIEIKHGEEAEILGRKFRFLNLYSPNVPQFGFRMTLGNGKGLVFHGDVPFNEKNRTEIQGTDWLLHEAFHLESAGPGMPPMGGPGMPPMGGPGGPGGPGKGSPGGMGHSTVKAAAGYAQSLGVKNLVLFHGSDNDLPRRKQAYIAEAKTVFTGNVYAPDDLDEIVLD